MRRLRRAEKTDLWTDAPMKYILSLSGTHLDKVADASLILARNDLYKWVLVSQETSH